MAGTFLLRNRGPIAALLFVAIAFLCVWIVARLEFTWFFIHPADLLYISLVVVLASVSRWSSASSIVVGALAFVLVLFFVGISKQVPEITWLAAITDAVSTAFQLFPGSGAEPSMRYYQVTDPNTGLAVQKLKPLSEGIGYWLQIQLLFLAVAAVWLAVPIHRLWLRFANIGEKGSHSQARSGSFLATLSMGSVRIGIILALGVLTWVTVYPGSLHFWLAPNNDSALSFAIWQSSFPAIAFIILLASLVSPPRERVDALAFKSTEIVSNPPNPKDIEQAFSDLKSSNALLGSLRLKTSRTLQPVSAKSNASDDTKHASASRVMAQFGSSIDHIQVPHASQRVEAYEKWRTAEYPDKGADRGDILFEDTLLDFKVLPIAEVFAHHVERGRNVVLIADRRRVTVLQQAIAQVLGYYTPGNWVKWTGQISRMTYDRTDAMRPIVLYGSPEAVLQQIGGFLGKTGDQSDVKHFWEKVSLVAALDIHALDVVELADVVRLIDATIADQNMAQPQHLFHTEPVHAAKTALGNTLGLDRKIVPLTLATLPARNQCILVWNYSLRGDLAATDVITTHTDSVGNRDIVQRIWNTLVRRAKTLGQQHKTEPQPKSSVLQGIVADLLQKTSQVQVIDEIGEEDSDSWSVMDPGRANGRSVISVDGLGRYAVSGAGSFIDRDRGNLASAILRDVATPAGNAGLLSILSDPLPVQETVRTAIWGKNARMQDMESDYIALKERVNAFLPRITEIGGGFTEIAREIARTFVVSETPVDVTLLTRILRTRLQDRFENIDIQFESGLDPRRVMSARVLSAMFGAITGKDFSDVFEDVDSFFTSNKPDQIRCNATNRLTDIAFGRRLRSTERVGRQDEEFELPSVDLGLLFHSGSFVVNGGTNYLISAIGKNGTFSVRGANVASGIEGRFQEIFARSYELRAPFLDKFPECRIDVASVFGLVGYTRETSLKTRRKFVSPQDRENPVGVDGINWTGAFAEMTYLRMALPHGAEPERVAVALAISLRDVIELLFPAVAHRIAVLSPQITGAHSASDQVEALRLCRLTQPTSDGAIAKLRASAGLLQPNGRDAASQIEIIVLEDSDGALGVVDAIHQAFKTIGTGSILDLVDVWQRHLRTRSGFGAAGFGTSVASPDWDTALEVLSGQGQGT